MIAMVQIGLHRCFEYSTPIDTTVTGPSDYIIVPADMDRTAVQLYVASTASVQVEASISTISQLNDGTAKWLVWDNGPITGNITSQDATKGPVGALRYNVVGALPGVNGSMSIRCQRGTP